MVPPRDMPKKLAKKAAKKAPKKGRPPRSTAGAATIAILFRVTVEEHAALVTAAAAAGKSLAAFSRDAALSVTERA